LQTLRLLWSCGPYVPRLMGEQMCNSVCNRLVGLQKCHKSKIGAVSPIYSHYSQLA